MAAKKSVPVEKVDNFAQAIGLGIRLRRDTLDKTQATLAKAAGLSVKRLGAIERGEVMPSDTEYVAIRKALKVAAEISFGKVDLLLIQFKMFILHGC